jgi:hypothetical protein
LTTPTLLLLPPAPMALSPSLSLSGATPLIEF